MDQLEVWFHAFLSCHGGSCHRFVLFSMFFTWHVRPIIHLQPDVRHQDSGVQCVFLQFFWLGSGLGFLSSVLAEPMCGDPGFSRSICVSWRRFFGTYGSGFVCEVCFGLRSRTLRGVPMVLEWIFPVRGSDYTWCLSAVWALFFWRKDGRSPCWPRLGSDLMDRSLFLILVQAGASSKAVAKPGPRDDAELDDEVPTFVGCF